MKTLLRIDSSLFGANGASHGLTDAFVRAWRHGNPGGRVIERDLAADPLPHLDAATFTAFRTPAGERTVEQQALVRTSDALIAELAAAGERTVEQQALVRTSDALIAELAAADVIVLGLPMYNFGVPSTVKAWFDHVARAGVTFRYTAEGPVGMLTGKQVYVFATRGGAYAGTPADTETPYVRDFLAFVGLADVEFVYAESLAGAGKAEALQRAEARIGELAAPWRAAA